MPIYAYRCEHCGHAKDVLQKVSDPVLTVCPACGEPAFRKQVTAAGFQLKGSGWYVTDFRGDKSTRREGAEAGATDGKASGDAAGEGSSAAKTGEAAAPAGAGNGKAAEAAKPGAAPAASAAPAAPAAAPAASGSAAGSGPSGSGRQG